MTYKQALKQCKKVGTAHASGDALRAMYANLLTVQHGGDDTDAERYYEALLVDRSGCAMDDKQIAECARVLLKDRDLAWERLFSARLSQRLEVMRSILHRFVEAAKRGQIIAGPANGEYRETATQIFRDAQEALK